MKRPGGYAPQCMALVTGLLLAGCDNTPPGGPVAVHWDRDTCSACRMLLSDRRYAAQVLDGSRQHRLFDDPGEMLHWLCKNRRSGDGALILWVTDAGDGSWLPARHAHYETGHLTPMGYGLGARRQPAPQTLDYAAALAWIARESELPSCPPPAEAGP
ncbi:MAG: nitrous oxide reductase accessory protein NosL [Magnetococcus sp. WYHC-3]